MCVSGHCLHGGSPSKPTWLELQSFSSQHCLDIVVLVNAKLVLLEPPLGQRRPSHLEPFGGEDGCGRAGAGFAHPGPQLLSAAWREGVTYRARAHRSTGSTFKGQQRHNSWDTLRYWIVWAQGCVEDMVNRSGQEQTKSQSAYYQIIIPVGLCDW